MDQQAALAQAVACHQTGNLDEAEKLCRAILSSAPRQAVAMTLLGTIQLQRSKLDESVGLLKSSLALHPQQPNALYCLGMALHGLNRPAEALASYERAIALVPDLVQAHNNRGLVLEQMGRVGEALASYDKALAINPTHAVAHSNRGNALSQLERFDEALTSYERAIALNPRNANAFYNRGIALSRLQRHEEAVASYDRAIALMPNYAKAHTNRGLSLAALRRHDEALASLQQALALAPKSAEASNNLGNTLRDMGRYSEALVHYDRAAALSPELADVQLNKAYVKILLGDYSEGWRLHEARWRHSNRKIVPRNFPQPLWTGHGDLVGKTILLHAEQGYGDSIQFSRYVPRVEALGADVLLDAPQPLVGLLSTLTDSVRVIPSGSRLPDFDCHCPLMSLPFAFGTTVDSVPADTPYLTVAADKQVQWRDRIGPPTKPRIGLVWSGNPQHTNDHNRSILLALLNEILEADCEFHCLQKDIRPTDRVALNEYASIRLHEAELVDFSDAAALITEMDLVVTVDTAAAHLAGALGKTVWVLLPFSPDYRWLIERDDSPWYPTARLFRQSRAGDWISVVARLRAELNQWLARGARA